MDDLISRQAAIDGADAIIARDTSGNNDVVKAMTAWKRYVEALPSAQPRKKGKWKETDDGWDGTYYVCSECGCPWTLIDGTPEDNGMNYCPNCGADMRGEDDEQVD